MNITREQKFILFALGTCNAECSKRFADKPITVTISKGAFIELAMKSNIVGKKERALYKNLELLEKKKLVDYSNKSLHLTNRGQTLYGKVQKELQPYFAVSQILNSQDILNFTKKARAVLKNE